MKSLIISAALSFSSVACMHLEPAVAVRTTPHYTSRTPVPAFAAAAVSPAEDPDHTLVLQTVAGLALAVGVYFYVE